MDHFKQRLKQQLVNQKQYIDLSIRIFLNKGLFPNAGGSHFLSR
jgi:hypothetical protein